MKSNSRKYLFCQFCGSSKNLNREHIFGESLSKRLPRAKVVIPRSALSEGLDPSRADRRFWRGGGENLLAMTSHSLCKNCNSDFGDEHGFVTNHLASLFLGKVSHIPEKLRLPILRYFQRAAIVLDYEDSMFNPFLMTESESDIKFNSQFHSYDRPPILTDEERHRFRSGKFLEKIEVYLGRYCGANGRSYAMEVAPIFDIDTFSRGGAGLVHGKKFVVAIQATLISLVVGKGNGRNGRLRRLTAGKGRQNFGRKTTATDADLARMLNRRTNFSDGTYSTS